LLIAAPAQDANYNYARFAKWADALIVMVHDKHFETTAPGPIAGQGWFEAVLREQFERVDPSKLIISIGNYGYDWAGPGSRKEISVQEAWELLAQSGGALHFDKASLNPTFTYIDDVEREQHQGLVSGWGNCLQPDCRRLGHAASGPCPMAAWHRGSKRVVGFCQSAQTRTARDQFHQRTTLRL
jgi:hypothetical protein